MCGGLCAGSLGLAGCTGAGAGGGGALRIESSIGEAVLRPRMQTGIYGSPDRNTADIFLSDFEADELLAVLRGDRAGRTGNLVHIHMFLLPRAGQTPIDFTASNATMTHVVFSGAGVGVYGGGGFLLPKGAPGGSVFGGTVRGATLRLLRSTDGFSDLLGTSELSGAVSARRDEDRAAELSNAMLRLLSQ